MPRTKDATRHTELARAQVIEAYFLVRDELRAKSRLLGDLTGEVEELQSQFENLTLAAEGLGVPDKELKREESSSNEATVVLNK
jgi:hypothetical protein